MLIDKIKYDGKMYYNVDSNSNMLPAPVMQQALIDKAWRLVRAQRDTLLRDSDYAVMPDYPLTESQKADVTAYRQALRDIPQGFDTPDAVEWPTKPEVLMQ
ncbi:tail fiber assembly protein [Halomonas elongata]|uniref:tail fiber assembly protein n=1 Tax=Halomonas elongata TaxID=2746 RepID=UPI0023B1182C|nr:tail fiber assembly protein [Halomonas elongata]